MAYETEQAIYDRLRQAPTFHPAGVSLFAPDWTLEPGDVVTVRSGEDSYRMPVYSLDLQWQGQSKVGIQSTGNQKREPLPALQRRQYAAGRASYQQEQDIEELKEQTVQYTQQFEVSDQKIASIMTATGVLLDDNNNPKVDPETGLFVFDTSNQGATLMSRIDQTAAGISSVVSQVGTVTAVFDKDHPGGYAIGDRVLHNGTAYRFTQAHAQGTDWTGTDVTAIPVMQTEITRVGQTADNVFSEVVAARDGRTSLKSRIDQEADRISLVVTGTGQNARVNTAGIILAINGGGEGASSVTISADKIDLQGYVTASELFATDAEIGQYLKATNIITTGTIKTAMLDVLNGADIEGGLTVTDGSTLTGGVVVDSITIGYPAAQGRQLTKTAVDGLLTAVTLTPPASGQNTYTLSATKLDGTTAQIGTFSRATSLSGGWSGGTYTVTASPQGQAWSIDFVRGSTSDATLALELGTGTVSPNNEKYLDFPVYIGSDNPSGQMTPNVTINKSINASAVWQKGYDYGKTQAEVVTRFATAVVPPGASPTPLTSGEKYKLLVTREGSTVLEQYYSVPAQAAQRTATAVNGSGSGGKIPLTSSDIGDSVSKAVTVVYNSGNSTSLNVTIDASAVYSAGQSSVTGRTVTSITPTITLSDTNTGTSTHNVTVTYSDGGTSPSTVSVNAARVYSAGQSSVSIDTATITQITASASMRAASASVYIKLSNGDEKTLTNVDVSPFYQAGLDGQAQPSGRTNVRLVDENDTFIKTATKTIDVSEVYQKGVDDATPATNVYYAYANGNTNNMGWYANKTGGSAIHRLPHNSKVYLLEDSVPSSGRVNVGYYDDDRNYVTGYINAVLMHTTPREGYDISEYGWDGASPVAITSISMSSIYYKSSSYASNLSGILITCDYPTSSGTDSTSGSLVGAQDYPYGQLNVTVTNPFSSVTHIGRRYNGTITGIKAYVTINYSDGTTKSGYTTFSSSPRS